jgi:hypothetical protein
MLWLYLYFPNNALTGSFRLSKNIPIHVISTLLESYSFCIFILYVAKVNNSVKRFGQVLRNLRDDMNWTLVRELNVDRAYI